MRPTIRIEGTDAIARRLKAMSAALQRQMVEDALTAGAEIVAEEARRLVPVRTGNLRDSIGVVKNPQNAASGSIAHGASEILVGPRESAPNNGFYGDFIEFGRAGGTPQPFMRPAFEAKAKEATDVVLQRLADEVDRAARS